MLCSILLACLAAPFAFAQTAVMTNPDGSVGISPVAPVPNVPGGIVASPPAVAVMNHLSAGSLVFLQPNQQTYFVENRQGIFTWQPVNPSIALSTLPPYLVIECYPEVPTTVGGPLGFVSLVRADAGQFNYNIPTGWAGENWDVILREQGGSVIVAGQKFAIKKEGTPLSPTMNLAGNPLFTPGGPAGWPARSSAVKVDTGVTSLLVGMVATWVALMLV